VSLIQPFALVGGMAYSGNALCRFNEVALRRAWLVLRWVIVYEQVNHISQLHRSTQPSTLSGMVKWVSAYGLSG